MSITGQRYQLLDEAAAGALLSNPDVVSLCGDRVYPFDAMIIAVDQFPTITIESPKILPTPNNSVGAVKKDVELSVRGYVNILDRENFTQQRNELAGAIEETFIDNFTVDGSTYLTEWRGTFKKYVSTENIALGFVEVLFGCKLEVPRFL